MLCHREPSFMSNSRESDAKVNLEDFGQYDYAGMVLTVIPNEQLELMTD